MTSTLDTIAPNSSLSFVTSMSPMCLSRRPAATDVLLRRTHRRFRWPVCHAPSAKLTNWCIRRSRTDSKSSCMFLPYTSTSIPRCVAEPSAISSTSLPMSVTWPSLTLSDSRILSSSNARVFDGPPASICMSGRRIVSPSNAGPYGTGRSIAPSFILQPLTSIAVAIISSRFFWTTYLSGMGSTSWSVMVGEPLNITANSAATLMWSSGPIWSTKTFGRLDR